MRGITFALICSIFLNSTFGYQTNNMLSLNDNAVSEITVSENQIMTYESDFREDHTVSENDGAMDLSDFDINDYEIFGETKDGKSIAIKKSMAGHEGMPSKPFAKTDFDWTTVEIEDEVKSLSMQIYRRTGDESKRIYVSSEKDMLALAAMWDQGETFKGMEIIQTENIVFTRKFPGIGFGDDDAEKFGFQGTFDGNGYVFYGIKHISDRGIFPAIGRGGVVKNVTLLAGDLNLKKGEVEYFNPLTERNLGLIENYYLEANVIADKGIYIWPCTYANLGTIRDSVIKGNVSAEMGSVGGFSSYNVAGGKILNCYNHCNVETTYGLIGGIASKSVGTLLQINDVRSEKVVVSINVGEAYPRDCFPDITSEEVYSYRDEENDIIFYYLSPLIQDCYNYGNISTGEQCVGGIAGSIRPTAYSVIYEDDNGNITKIENWDFYSDGMLVDCINYGNISGRGYSAGGIAAEFGEMIKRCANYGKIEGSMQVGGIGGGSSSGSTMEPHFGIVSCMNYGDILGIYATGGIMGSASGIIQDNYNRGNVKFNEKYKDELDERIKYNLGGLIGSIFFDDYKLGRAYSTGNVEKVSDHCNGLIGYLKREDYPEDFYLTGNMEGIENQQGYVTEEWLKSDEALASLGSAFKKDIYGINDGYPILAWQTEKANKMQVRFVTQGGGMIENQYLYGGELVKEPKAPAREGAEFEGWYTDASYTSKWDFSKPANSSMSFYAKWNDSSKTKQYKVTLLTDGGTYDLSYGFPEEIYVWEGSLLEDIEIPVKEQYSFVGWGIDGSTTDLWDLEKDRVTEDVELTAIWKYEGHIWITFYHCGADNQTDDGHVQITYYAAKLEPWTYTKKNHEFAGWFTEKNGKGTQYTEGMRVYGDLKLYAYWISNERYTVTFDTMGGNELPAIEGIVPESCIEIPIPVKQHSVFMGWYTKPNGEGECYTEETPITENITLYAFWQDDIQEGEYRIQAIEKQVYTGDKVMPEVKVYYQDKLLTEEKDYTLTYVNCVSVGTAKVYIHSNKDNSDFKLKYQIVEKNLQDEDVSCKVYNSYIDSKTGMSKMPVVEITYKGQFLTKDVDYTVKINEESGQPSVMISGKGNFIGNREVTFAVEEKKISDVTIQKLGKYSYTGKEIKPVLEVATKEGTALVAGRDYECVYSKNIIPGKAEVEIRGIGAYAGSKKVNFTIVKKMVAEEDIKVAVTASETYDGGAKKPEVVVTQNDTILEQGKDYTLSYSNNKNASEKAVITIKGKGNYSGQRKEYFTIAPKTIESAEISVEDGLYNKGKAVQPKVVVKDGKKTLKKNKDYKIEYSNNTQAGMEAKVTIQGAGNYTGTSQQQFRIVSDLITNAKVSKIAPYVYSGESFKPEVEVYYKDQLLTENTDYEIKYPEEENINAGKGSFYIIGKGIYGGKKKVTYVINKKPIESTNGEFVLQSVETLKYTGTKVTPKVELLYKGTALTEGVDYKLSYQNNVNAGNKAKVTIQGIGNFKGSWKTEFTITPADITETLIEAQDVAYKENKKAVPKVILKYNNKNLKEKKDYVVTYDSNTKCQDGEVMVKGIGNFAGSGEQIVKVPYHVYEVAIGKAKVEKIAQQIIARDEILEPEVKLSYGGKVLKEDVDYTLEYSNNAKPGKAKVVIRGLGQFGGSKTITFQIKKK